ncbi:MAG: flagellar motor switch protein FliM [Candidatus Neomarinimicrobiota bacterium]
MSKILSQEEIDALISNVPETDAGGDVNRLGFKRKITVYDFKRPNLVSKDQMRLLETIHETICRNFGVFLSAQLRMMVEINLHSIDQVIYSEYVMSIAPPGCIYICELDEPASNFILEMSPQLAIFIVERLFGGRGKVVSTIRPISGIEQKIVGRVVDRFLREIDNNWSGLSPFKSRRTRFDSNPEFVQIASSSEPVVVVTVEVKVHNGTSLLNLCYPYNMVSNILSKPEVQEKMLFGSTISTRKERDVIEAKLNRTPVELDAVLGSNNISIKDFIELQVGDIIQLKTRIGQEIPVRIENQPVFSATMGKKNKYYALQITSSRLGDNNEE